MSASKDNPSHQMRGSQVSSANPWYVLATIFGEQHASQWDKSLHERNRRIWNGWCGKHLPATQLERFVNSLRLNTSEFAPWTPDETVHVEIEFSKRNLIIPDSQERIDFRGICFSEIVNLSNFTFFAPVSFCGAEFRDEFSILDANFVGGLEFRDARCERRADFGFLKCHEIADFRGAKFSELAVFNHAIFSGVTLFGNVDFVGNVLFQNVNFGGKLEFVYSHFFGEAAFSAAEFRGETKFRACQFDGLTYFEDSRICNRLDLSDSVFSKALNFRDAHFQKYYPKLAGATLHPTAQFSAKDEFWPKATDASAEESREALAVIRHLVGKQGLPEDEHYFYRREMAFAAQIGPFWARLPYQAFETFSDFGHSIAKPACWLAGIWLYGAALYCWWLIWIGPAAAAPRAVLTAAGFSFAQVFGFLGLSRPLFGDEFVVRLPSVLKFVAGAQTVTGVILLFLLALALRNRFRLK